MFPYVVIPYGMYVLGLLQNYKWCALWTIMLLYNSLRGKTRCKNQGIFLRTVMRTMCFSHVKQCIGIVKLNEGKIILNRERILDFKKKERSYNQISIILCFYYSFFFKSAKFFYLNFRFLRYYHVIIIKKKIIFNYAS